MASVITETKAILLQGPTERLRVIGFTTMDGGTDNFRIIPGANTVSITEPYNTRGLRSIDSWGVTCRSQQNVNDIICLAGYSTSTDSVALLVNGAANQTYDWWVEGDYVGA